jgi:cell division protease FtsH
LLLLVALAWTTRMTAAGASEVVPWSELKSRIESGAIVEVVFDGGLVHARVSGESEPTVRAIRVADDGDFVAQLDRKGVAYRAVPPGPCQDGALVWSALLMLPLLLLGAILLTRLGGTRGAAAFGRSQATMVPEEGTGVTFADVAGVDEAAEELQEVVAFLKTPEKFTALGGRPPKGVLLVGPPGTGKTLLARAVAGEAGVAFLSISGSAFVEMFVGVGAARVRDLFRTATEHAPCIIFVDELDAVGKSRSAGPMSNDEREQTLNQLLVEMDGFDNRKGVIVMAATNRPETLDSALMRPGRFDRQVLVDRPDVSGRLAILKVHGRRLRLAPDVDLSEFARMTPGFAGADLAAVLNEAALLAARRDRSAVAREDLNDAVERVVAGLEKKSRRLSADEKRTVAWHECGHAVCAAACPGADPVKKISIIPRGVAALGYTLQLPTEDRHLVDKSGLIDRITVLYGGRAAEELVFGDVTTGASDDIRRATELARRMVTEWGMARRLGPLHYGTEASGDAFRFGESRPGGAGPSGSVAEAIEREIREIADVCHARALEILSGNRTVLEEMASALIETEVLEGERMTAFLSRVAPVAPVEDPPTSEIHRA